MSVTIIINSLSLCHKGSNGISTATIPDVCKTPAPGGPVPIPYPNIAFSRDLLKGTTSIKADGGNMSAKYGSEFFKSTGDEAGTVGGVASNTFIKEASWITFSFDVKFEGKGACRLTDKMFHNHQNTVNMSGEIQKDPKVKNKMLACPPTKPNMNKLPRGWQKYKGMSAFGVDWGRFLFHGGFVGIKETRKGSVDQPQNECFYDEKGKLIDENHPYAGTKGTPNQYDASDKYNHTVKDSGGIVKSGPRALGASAGKHADTAWNATKDKAGAAWDATKDNAGAAWDSVKGIFN